jgi:hypothetical protein
MADGVEKPEGNMGFFHNPRNVIVRNLSQCGFP